jgi:hypothetical protein
MQNTPNNRDPNVSLTLDEMLEKYENGEATHSEILEIARSLTKKELEELGFYEIDDYEH